MSNMAVASGAARSTLNPNAPLFIPAAFQQVEDFSPEWWDLVKTSTWFRENWFHQHQEQETFDRDNDNDDIANLLPESFDLCIEDEFSSFDELDESVFHQPFVSSGYTRKEKLKPGTDTDLLLKALNLKSPKNCGARNMLEPIKHWEKPTQVVSPKPSPRCIIQQPR